MHFLHRLSNLQFLKLCNFCFYGLLELYNLLLTNAEASFLTSNLKVQVSQPMSLGVNDSNSCKFFCSHACLTENYSVPFALTDFVTNQMYFTIIVSLSRVKISIQNTLVLTIHEADDRL